MRLSVARRLALLAAAEVGTVALLVVVAVGFILRVESSERFVRRYLLPPATELGVALVENAQLLDVVESKVDSGDGVSPDVIQAHFRDLAAVRTQYRTTWNVNDTPRDAQRARAALQRVDRLDLVDRENAAVTRFDDALGRFAAVAAAPDPAQHRRLLLSALSEIQNALRELRNVNAELLDTFQSVVQVEVSHLRRILVLVGIGGTLLAGLSALRVRSAIAPRIRRLVESVRKFRELGVHERVFDTGRDEIAILGHALDAGFTAIAERDRERQRFLAVASHELKTPLTAILGFAQIARAQPAKPEVAQRALSVVERQATRLVRLVDEVFLTVRARTGDLALHVEPIDLVPILLKAVADVELGSERPVDVQAPGKASVLGDPRLLAQAFWSLLTYAAAASGARERLAVTVSSTPPVAEVRVAIPAHTRVEVERALSPLEASTHEGAGRPTSVGLYLSREISRLHGGTLRIEDAAVGVEIILELPS